MGMLGTTEFKCFLRLCYREEQWRPLPVEMVELRFEKRWGCGEVGHGNAQANSIMHILALRRQAKILRAFKTLGMISGAGNSNAVTRYEYLDENAEIQACIIVWMVTDFIGFEHFAGMVIVDAKEKERRCISISCKVAMGWSLICSTRKGDARISVYSVDGSWLYEMSCYGCLSDNHIRISELNAQGVINRSQG